MDLVHFPPLLSTVTPLAFRGCCFLFFFFAAAHKLLHSHWALPFPPTVAAAVAPHFSNETDRLALLRFKDEIIGDPFGVFASWNDSRHFCEWQRVTCGRRHPQRVTALNLRSCNLVARRISPHISNLTFLASIDLANNTFHGVIPTEIGRLFRLQRLSLRNNTLSGEIPVNLTYCSELMKLDLRGTKLSGNIPVKLGSLSKLTFLDLGFNHFTGRIPPSFGNLSSLTYLYLSFNRLEGSIPVDLSQMTSLTGLGVCSNQLSGIVPSSIYNLSFLQALDLGGNGLIGNLPPSLFLTLANLTWFSVWENQFTGPIPVSLPNATGLQVVEFNKNHFKGLVPENLGSLQHLRRLRFSTNELGSDSGQHLRFLDSLTNCSNLEVLDVSGNRLSGALPDSVANLSTQLQGLFIGGNMIFGRIPSAIGNLINVEVLGMEYNMLAGTIPISIGKLSKMVQLYMSSNKFSGKIPDSFCSMTQLSVLHLYQNNVEGNIPKCLENLRQLQDMRLYSNNFKGTLPKQLFSLPSLYQILVGNNFLSGNLKMEVDPLKSLQTLDVSDNNFWGEIPSSLGSCLSLEFLLLSGNRFQGLLPSTLDSLRGLRHLDLSSNQLSGKIPEYLEKIQLEYLNLSFNDFEGELPREGIFKNASAISIVGNSKLCGGIEELHVLPCIQEPSKKTLHVTNIKVMATVTVVGSIVLSCLLALFVYMRFRNSRNKPSSGPSALEDPFKDVSYADLLKATDGFSSSNLIGSGSYGSVYEGTLHRNNIGVTMVAVKVLNLLQEGALKSFMAECEALRNIRHRNLIKILTCCSSIDFRGNDFKALVFEYMANGSLQNWLSRDNEGNNTISARNFKLIGRLNIAIDVASALDYLHCHCQAPIVHRDLKPSNVLLDDDMVAHIGDFGLARFVSATAQSSTVGMKGSIGYIAPEYAMGGKASTEGDVYSYGILILEMITGKGPTDGMFENNLTLHHHVRLALLADQITEIADPYLLLEEADQALQSDHSKKKMHECLGSIARIGVACSAESSGERMKMREVVAQMHGIRDLYLGVRGQGRQIRTETCGEGSSSLSMY